MPTLSIKQSGQFLHVSIDGQEVVLRALDRVMRDAEDWREAWDECETLFHQIEARQFGSQGGRGGSPWQPLSKAYAKWKTLKFPGKPLLVLTGKLKASLTGRSADSIHDAQKDSLTLGSSLAYGDYHQRGTRKMPARPPIVITTSDLGQFARRMTKRMETVGQRAGFKTARKVTA